MVGDLDRSKLEKYTHDIIPKEIFLGPFDKFKDYLHNLNLPHWLCKQIMFNYLNFHGIKITGEQLLEVCPEDDLTDGQ